MSLRTIALLALSAVTLAHPTGHHHHHGTGTGGFMLPTGGPFPLRNGTGFGAASSVAPAATTLTVVPLPADSSAAVVPVSSMNIPVDIVNNNQADTTVNAEAPPATTPCTSSTVTSTVTSIEYFSVTVTPSADVAAVSITQFFGLSSTSSVSLSTSASVAAGGFFQHSNGGGFSSIPAFSSVPAFSSTPAFSVPVPTTFATSMLPSIGASASATFSSALPTASTIPSTGTSGKKGLSYNVASLTDVFAGTGMTWAYNWASAPGGTIASGLEYVPMLWGENSVNGWSSAASSAISSGSSHLLSFNEPDLAAQSNMSPSDAATLHIAQMNPFAGKAQIGSPAVTNGAGSSPPMGITWLSQFFSACAGNCKVDFVAFHYYNDASQIEDFKTHVGDVISTAAANGVSTVWLTEFGATGSDADVASFLSEALIFLDSQPAVERYAYFMCGDGTLLSGTSLSTVGMAYAA